MSDLNVYWGKRGNTEYEWIYGNDEYEYEHEHEKRKKTKSGPIIHLTNDRNEKKKKTKSSYIDEEKQGIEGREGESKHKQMHVEFIHKVTKRTKK